MATEAQPTSPYPQSRIVEQIAMVLASGAPVAAMVTILTGVLGALGISTGVVQAVVYLVLKGTLPTPSSPGPAVQSTMAMEANFRAAYLRAAAQRLQAGVNQGTPLSQLLKTEMAYFKLHLAAQQNRRNAAEQVDRVAAGDLMAGWKAVLDAKTSPECRAADGKNYFVAYPPAIGYPGAVHPHCRCKPVKAYVGAPMVDKVTSNVPARVLVAA